MTFFLSLQYVIVTCAKFASPYQGAAQQQQEKRYPFLPVWVVFICVQTRVRLPLFGICNMHTDVDVCVWLHTRAVRTPSESALKADSGRKISSCTGDSNPRQCCAWLFSRTLHQLSHLRPSTITLISAIMLITSRISATKLMNAIIH